MSRSGARLRSCHSINLSHTPEAESEKPAAQGGRASERGLSCVLRAELLARLPRWVLSARGNQWQEMGTSPGQGPGTAAHVGLLLSQALTCYSFPALPPMGAEKALGLLEESETCAEPRVPRSHLGDNMPPRSAPLPSSQRPWVLGSPTPAPSTATARCPNSIL